MVGLAFLAIMPRESVKDDFQIHVPKVKNLLLDRWLLTVGLSLLGLEFASALVGNFMVFYLSSGLRENPLISGIIASLLPISGAGASVSFGKIFDRTKNMKPLILILGILTGFGLTVSTLNNLNGSILSTFLVGFFGSAGFIVCVAASRQLGKHEMEYEVLGVSWVISLSLVGSFFGPIIFSYAVIFLGYEFAWIFSGLISIGFFAPLSHAGGFQRREQAERGTGCPSGVVMLCEEAAVEGQRAVAGSIRCALQVGGCVRDGCWRRSSSTNPHGAPKTKNN